MTKLLATPFIGWLKNLPWKDIGVLVLGAVALLLVTNTCSRLFETKEKLRSAQEDLNTIQKARTSDEVSDIQREDDRDRLQKEAEQLKEATHGIEDRPLSARQRARLECLRKQRLARESGAPVPVCG